MAGGPALRAAGTATSALEERRDVEIVVVVIVTERER
jgi:hypothetical protein